MGTYYVRRRSDNRHETYDIATPGDFLLGILIMLGVLYAIFAPVVIGLVYLLIIVGISLLSYKLIKHAIKKRRVNREAPDYR